MRSDACRWGLQACAAMYVGGGLQACAVGLGGDLGRGRQGVAGPGRWSACGRCRPYASGCALMLGRRPRCLGEGQHPCFPGLQE
mgnify:CR=1 FL=1